MGMWAASASLHMPIPAPRGFLVDALLVIDLSLTFEFLGVNWTLWIQTTSHNLQPDFPAFQDT